MKTSNKLFPSHFLPLFQNESLCTTLYEIEFHLLDNKSPGKRLFRYERLCTKTRFEREVTATRTEMTQLLV